MRNNSYTGKLKLVIIFIGMIILFSSIAFSDGGWYSKVSGYSIYLYENQNLTFQLPWLYDLGGNYIGFNETRLLELVAAGSTDYTHVQNYSGEVCPNGNYSYGYYQNGTPKCRDDLNTGTGGTDTWANNITFYWNASQLIVYFANNNTDMDLKITNNLTLYSLHTNVANNHTSLDLKITNNISALLSTINTNLSQLNLSKADHSNVANNATALDTKLANNITNVITWDTNNLTYVNNMINQNDTHNNGQFINTTDYNNTEFYWNADQFNINKSNINWSEYNNLLSAWKVNKTRWDNTSDNVGAGSYSDAWINLTFYNQSYIDINYMLASQIDADFYDSGEVDDLLDEIRVNTSVIPEIIYNVSLKVPYVNAIDNVRLGIYNLSSYNIIVNRSIIFRGNPDEDGGNNGIINYTSDGAGGIIKLGPLNYFAIPVIPNCDTVNTDATGRLICGTDSTGSGADYTVIQNGSSVDCVEGNYSYGRYLNGTWKCSPDLNTGGSDTWATNITFYWNASQLIVYFANNNTAIDLKITNNLTLYSLHTNVANNHTSLDLKITNNISALLSTINTNLSQLNNSKADHSNVANNATALDTKLANNITNVITWDTNNLTFTRSLIDNNVTAINLRIANNITNAITWDTNNLTYINNMINQNDTHNNGQFINTTDYNITEFYWNADQLNINKSNINWSEYNNLLSAWKENKTRWDNASDNTGGSGTTWDSINITNYNNTELVFEHGNLSINKSNINWSEYNEMLSSYKTNKTRWDNASDNIGGSDTWVGNESIWIGYYFFNESRINTSTLAVQPETGICLGVEGCNQDPFNQSRYWCEDIGGCTWTSSVKSLTVNLTTFNISGWNDMMAAYNTNISRWNNATDNTGASGTTWDSINITNYNNTELVFEHGNLSINKSNINWSEYNEMLSSYKTNKTRWDNASDNTGGSDTWVNNITFYWNASQLIVYFANNNTAIDLKITNNISALLSTINTNLSQLNLSKADHSNVANNATALDTKLANNITNVITWDTNNLTFTRSLIDNNVTAINLRIANNITNVITWNANNMSKLITNQTFISVTNATSLNVLNLTVNAPFHATNITVDSNIIINSGINMTGLNITQAGSYRTTKGVIMNDGINMTGWNITQAGSYRTTKNIIMNDGINMSGYNITKLNCLTLTNGFQMCIGAN
jgi:hypothetical protein